MSGTVRKDRMIRDAKDGVMNPCGGEAYISKWPPPEEESTMVKKKGPIMKPGIKTTEGWLTLVWNVLCILAAQGVIGGGIIDPGTAMMAGGVGTAGYGVSRGLAKKNGG